MNKFLLLPFIFLSCNNDNCLKLKSQNDSLKEIIVEQQEEIEILEKEIRWKEREISFYGHKLDSLVQKKKTK